LVLLFLYSLENVVAVCLSSIHHHFVIASQSDVDVEGQYDNVILNKKDVRKRKALDAISRQTRNFNSNATRLFDHFSFLN
jgi:hypothetical protein